MAEKDIKPWLFQPGQSGNPAGRAKGSRNKLQEHFLADMHAAWLVHGKDAIEAMIARRPGDFIKVVASLLPREATLNINDHSEMTDEELAERVRRLATQLAPFLAGRDGDAQSETGDAQRAALASRVH